MKCLVLIGDGMTDYPLKTLGGKTPLEAAKTPNMDFLAQNGVCGWVCNVPSGMQPGSDVANMSILGYDPRKYLSGRGPFEAASLGVKLEKDDVAFRCNLVTVENRKMKDFTAGHISTKEADKIIKKLDKELGDKNIRFATGLSYRHLLILKAESRRQIAEIKELACTPPHDITGKPIRNFLPKGEGAERLIRLMNESKVLLHGMDTAATMIWPWGQGGKPDLPSFRKKFGKKGAMITAVHLLKGIAKVLGLEVINVPGVTGYIDTNYRGKAEYALKALKKNDIVFVHVEAPDEAGHEGDARKKIRAIEDFDKYVVGTILQGVKGQGSRVKLLVLPDHPTPIRVMTHTAEAVPFVIWGTRDERRKMRDEKVRGYNEKEVGKAKLRIKNGHELLGDFFRNRRS